MNIIYLDNYDNEVSSKHDKATRFYIDESGALLVIDSDEDIIAAYAHKVWRSVCK